VNAEALLFWAAALGYAVATLLVTIGLVFRKERVLSASTWVVVGAFAAQTASIAVRWYTTGRLPYVEDYENLLAGTWAIILVYLVVVFVWPKTRAIGVAVLPFVLLSMGVAMTLSTQASPITPPYRSVWLGIHVLFAWATYAAYTAAASLAVIELLKSRKKPPREGSALNNTPSIERLQELTFKMVAFGFLVNAVMMASGAIWAYELWGSYWRWDPVETWSLLTWLAFGFYMHAQLTLGWRGPRLAWIAVGALFGVLMMFWGVQFAPTSYHLFRDLGGTMQMGGPQ